ncbi:MAG: serine protease [Gammaproteobacteria bacterium]|jgi:S1-C subfamily serine protease
MKNALFSFKLCHPLLLAIQLLVLLGCSISAWASDKEGIHSSIVKIIATHNHPDFASPWQRQGIHTVTGSGAIIEGKRILTNAHVVADQTSVEVQREGSGIVYTAQVAHVCHTCDLAILTVDDDLFFKSAKELKIDGLPTLQSRVNVYGFPTGGQTISITEGIVSRIEVDYYVHSSDRYLLVQVDAAINPGNSGGPAISNGKIIGIAMQALDNAENIGYIVPAPVIKHFLDDIKDGTFDGFPELDIYVQTIENRALRRSLKLPKTAGGLLITAVAENSNVSDVIQPGDVLLEIEGYKIERDGKVALTPNLRVESSHLEYMEQVGGTLSLRIQRNGKLKNVDIKLNKRKRRISQRRFDITPSYFVFAGMVFQPLSQGYLKTHRRASYTMIPYIPQYTLQGYRKATPELINIKHPQIIVLSRVLPDALNQGYKNMEGSIVFSVNGTEVKDLQHLIQLIEAASGDFLEIRTDFGNLITLDLSQARERNPVILRNYQVHSDRNLNQAVND